jgi:maltodextrin utilization protein YvdJ
VRIAVSPPLVVNAVKPTTPRLTAEEREQFRLWKNVIVFGFLVAVLVLVFWVLAR